MNEKITQKSLENSENSATGSSISQSSSIFQANTEQNPYAEAKSTENISKSADFTKKAGKSNEISSISADFSHNSSKNGENAIELSNNSENSVNSSKNEAISPNNVENSAQPMENEENSANSRAKPVNASDFFNSDSERELSASFPTVEIEKLRNSREFNQLLDLIIKNPTLAQVYSCFNSIVSSAEENSRLKLTNALATAEAGVGSLASSAPGEKAFFTRDEVLRMSQEEIKKNYTKIRQSQQLW